MESSIIASKDTIDFSSASDCVSVEFLRWLLPAAWFSRIYQVRCPSMLLGGDLVELEMISTMGNATTFPIETLVFWSIAVSSAMTVAKGPNNRDLLPSWKYFRKCSVFGDDCILPRAATSVFMDAATAVGFLDNKEKSFFDGGYFRESCGGDFYRGCDVRPVFLRAPTNDKLSSLEPWLYAFTNRIILKYISYFGCLGYVYEKDLFRELFAIFKKERLLVKVVPDWFPDDAGLKIGGDCFRFQQAYDIPFSRISRSDQGTYRFNYCRFNYRHKKSWFDPLRYALYKKANLNIGQLKSHSEELVPQDIVLASLMPLYKREVEHRYFIRKLGGYVVATGYTSCWSPNFGT
jgi:hypothetical protein